MSQQLNEQQIDHLFDFVGSKYVRYIDVQHELVDHLASAIEEEMEASGSTFESALQSVYGRFPITGFASFVAEKEKGMRRYWRLRQFAYLKTYFTFPKVLMTMAIFLVSWTVFGIDNPVVTAGYYAGALLWSVIAGASVTTGGDVKLSMWSMIAFLGGVLLAVAGMQWHIAWGITGLVIVAVGLLSFSLDNRVPDHVKARENYLVLASFYGSVWSFGTGLLLTPMYMGDMSFVAMGVDNLVVRIAVTAMVSLSLVFSHAVYTRFRHMLDEELQQKYPHLEIA